MSPLYETSARAVGGREGHVETADGRFKADLAMPKALGGNGNGANPEQLFAAGYAACFLGALKLVAGKAKVKLPEDTHIDGKVGIGPDGQGFGLAVTLSVTLPGLEQTQAEELVNTAHQVCPYSNATRGNIPVDLEVHV